MVLDDAIVLQVLEDGDLPRCGRTDSLLLRSKWDELDSHHSISIG